MPTLRLTDGRKEPRHLDALKLINTRLLVQASSGGGKSWLLRRICEQAAKHIQVIVLDPEGEFSTLREKHDFLLVGDEGELKADPKMAALLARKLVSLHISAVVDLYDLKYPQRREFVANFLESLMNVPKTQWHDILVVLDEAHIFAPEGGKQAVESANAVIDLMTQGRKRGFAGLMATQRLSSLSKDVAAQAKNVLVGSTTLDVDLQRAGTILGMDKKTRNNLIHLEAGEFYAFGPAFNFKGVKKLQVGGVTTTHPEPGKQRKLATPAASKAIRNVLHEFADLPQEAEAEITDMNQAKKKIKDLEKVLSGLKKQAEGTTTSEEVEQIQALLATAQNRAVSVEGTLGELLAYATDLTDRIALAVGCLTELPALPITETALKPQEKALAPKTMSKHFFGPIGAQSAGNGAQRASGLAQRVLDSILWWNQLKVEHPDRAQVAYRARSKPSSGHFQSTVSKLKTGGRVDYPSAGQLKLTKTGLLEAVAPAEMATKEQLYSEIRALLKGGLALRIYDALAVAECMMTRQDLAKAVGSEMNSGHFQSTVSKMRTGGLLDYPSNGVVDINPVLR